eukprot:294241-Rhodomonas_salina.1
MKELWEPISKVHSQCRYPLPGSFQDTRILFVRVLASNPAEFGRGGELVKVSFYLLLIPLRQQVPASLLPVCHSLACHLFLDAFEAALKSLFHQLEMLLREASFGKFQIDI